MNIQTNSRPCSRKGLAQLSLFLVLRVALPLLVLFLPSCRSAGLVTFTNTYTNTHTFTIVNIKLVLPLRCIDLFQSLVQSNNRFNLFWFSPLAWCSRCTCLSPIIWSSNLPLMTPQGNSLSIVFFVFFFFFIEQQPLYDDPKRYFNLCCFTAKLFSYQILKINIFQPHKQPLHWSCSLSSLSLWASS